MTAKTEQFPPMRVTADFMTKLDDLRRLEADLPARTEMIRRLVDRAHLKLVVADGDQTGRNKGEMSLVQASFQTKTKGQSNG